MAAVRHARAHARRLIAHSELPADTVIDRWWASSGEPCEVDVLGLHGSRSVLLGEARWQTRPLGSRELAHLRAKSTRVPHAVEDPIYTLWGRGGVDPAIRTERVLGFGPREMLAV